MQQQITPEYLAAQGFSADLPERFWSQVNKNGKIQAHAPELGPCWEWTGLRNASGYGLVRKGIRQVGKGNLAIASRVSWVLHCGPISGGLLVCHKCDNRTCVNPEHLFLGTYRDNWMDCLNKGRNPLVGPSPERCRTAKLSWEDVKSIRVIGKTQKLPRSQIAEMFDISEDTVWSILHNKTWRRRRVSAAQMREFESKQKESEPIEFSPSPHASALAVMGCSESFESRFWSNIYKTSKDSCWLWTAAKNAMGYGVIGKGPCNSGNVLAHRASWIIHNGAIPDGSCVLHKCDTPACVNPNHMWLGTRPENNADMARKGRRRAIGPAPERAANAKLSWSKVAEIRSIYNQGKTGQVPLSKMFGVSQHAIWAIINNITWRDATYVKIEPHLPHSGRFENASAFVPKT